VMRLTLPQIFMLNHAATVNAARAEERAEWKSKQKERKAKSEENDPVMPGTGGKRLSKCTSEEIAGQFRGM
jgi:hypothetical protein